MSGPLKMNYNSYAMAPLEWPNPHKTPDINWVDDIRSRFDSYKGD